MLAGLWLIALILLSVGTAAMIFSATQFQGRLAGLTIYGGPLSAWKADQIRDEWAAALGVVAAAKKVHDERQNELADLYKTRAELSKLDRQAGHVSTSLMVGIITKINRIDPKLITTPVDTLDAYEFMQEIAPIVEVTKQKDKSIEKDFDDLRVARDKWSATRNELDVQVKESRTLVDEISKAKTALDEARKNLHLELPKRQDKSVSPDELIQIENIVYEFQEMQKHFNPVYFLALAPSDLLVLLLVISMGVLGSCLQLSHVFTKEYGQHSISFYIFRPLAGVITAFVVFIVVKTGIPLIADSNRGGVTTANPYFISFLGIISGLLSDRALEWVRQIGVRYFQDTAQEDQLRWATHSLKADFENLKRDPDDVRQLLEAKESVFTAWIEGKEPMPRFAQTVIAATLGKPARDLFTDIAPKTT